jgi:hypothetical protein
MIDTVALGEEWMAFKLLSPSGFECKGLSRGLSRWSLAGVARVVGSRCSRMLGREGHDVVDADVERAVPVGQEDMLHSFDVAEVRPPVRRR